MSRALALVTVLALIGVGAVGCSKKAQPVGTLETTAGKAPEAPHGSRKKELVGAPVVVDGQLVAALAYGEMPTTVLPRSLEAGGEARYFRLYEYLKAVGVDVDRVRAVHVRGNGNRMAAVEGEELVRHQGRLVFDFLAGDGGGAKVAWETTGLKNTFRVDEIRALLVYVDKAVPELDARRSCYLTDGAAGEGKVCSDRIPHAEAALAKGTRVYLDGRLVGAVKRRNLTSELVVREERGVSQYGVARLAASLGVDVAAVRSVEVLAGDDVIARGNEPARHAQDFTFALPEHQSGRVLLTAPSTWSASETRDAEATAILLFKDTAPHGRALATVTPPETNAADAPKSTAERSDRVGG